MDYKEKILEEARAKANSVCLRLSEGYFKSLDLEDLEQILSSLPSKKEIAKGQIEKYISEIGFDTVHDKGKALLVHLTNWLNKEADEASPYTQADKEAMEANLNREYYKEAGE